MKKLNKKQIKEITKKLKPFWKKHGMLQSEFREKEEKLQKEMTKKIELGINLEFFYVDGDCCGIGAEDYSEREAFPLIHNSWL